MPPPPPRARGRAQVRARSPPPEDRPAVPAASAADPPPSFLARVDAGTHSVALSPSGSWTLTLLASPVLGGAADGGAAGNSPAAGRGGAALPSGPAAGVPSGYSVATWVLDEVTGECHYQNIAAAAAGDKGLGVRGLVLPTSMEGEGYRAAGRQHADKACVVPLPPHLACIDAGHAYLSPHQAAEYAFTMPAAVHLRTASLRLKRLVYENKAGSLDSESFALLLEGEERLVSGLATLLSVRAGQLQFTMARSVSDPKAHRFCSSAVLRIATDVYAPVGAETNTDQFLAGSDVAASVDKAVVAGETKALLQRTKAAALEAAGPHPPSSSGGGGGGFPPLGGGASSDGDTPPASLAPPAGAQAKQVSFFGGKKK